MDSRNSSNYKSVMCRYYIAGNCSRINCSFAHSTEEINNSRKKNANIYNKKDNDHYITDNNNFPNLSNNKVISKKNNNNETWINIAKKNISTDKLPVEKLIDMRNDLEQNCEIAKLMENNLNKMINDIKNKIKEVDNVLKELNEKNKTEEIVNKKKINSSSSDIVILPQTIFSNYNIDINKDNDEYLSDNEEYDDDDY